MSWALFKVDIYEKWKKYWYETHPPEVAAYSWDFLFTGGKEIRATLFYELWRYLSPETTVCGELAFALECIHVASLILDDTPWMDNAAERRGKMTLHRRFSPKKALLLCHDVMYMVYLIWTQQQPAHLDVADWHELMKTKLQKLMVGQWYDLNKEGTLMELASLKTGILFEFVAETVAVCVGLDANFWRAWGNSLGILFQWTDDWNDREEDVLQENRNAFHEDYDGTLQHYLHLWHHIERGIGAGWFERPFGNYMKGYFTQTMADPAPYTIPPNVMDLRLPYPVTAADVPPPMRRYRIEKKGVFRVMDGNDMLAKMLLVADYLFARRDNYIQKYMGRYVSLQHQLWNIAEEEWVHHRELRDTLHDVIEDALDDWEDGTMDVFSPHELKRVARDALQELEEAGPELYWSDANVLLDSAVEQLEQRDVSPDLKDLAHRVREAVNKK